MRPIYNIALATILIAGGAMGASAQSKADQNLNKVITLDKDFVPVEKKATKKNKLPKVEKEPAKVVTAPTYSTWARPTVVPSLVPTMDPYGYRTLHHFSTQNGYLVVGAGTQLNMNGSVGYRIIDEDSTRLGVWLQHGSTWNGKNTSPLVPVENRQKQKYNDNLLGIDLYKTFTTGTLSAGLRGEFDSFNYYGGWSDFLVNNKQSFFNVDLDAKWAGQANVANNDFDYRFNLGTGIAGYGKGIENNMGAREVMFRFGFGGDYNLSDNSSVGADFNGKIVNLKHYDTYYQEVTDLKDTYGLFTLSPYYKLKGDNYRATLGLNMDFSMSDGAKFRLSPAVKVELDVARGAVLYANVGGGKELNTLAAMHAINRYSAPRERYASYYSPLDLEAGMKVGPFKGFSLKVFGGYGIFNGTLDAFIPVNKAAENPYIDNENPDVVWTQYIGFPESVRYASTHYKSVKYRGAKVGAELNYKYRHLVDFNARIVYCPVSNDEYKEAKYNKGYSLNFYDGTMTHAQVDLKVTPIRGLAINLGLEYRGNRSILVQDYANVVLGAPEYYYTDLADVWNLKAGASYRLAQPVSVWIEASNLLNRKWDEMPGMSAQKLCIMGGVAFNF